MSYNFAISRKPIPADIEDPWTWINSEIEVAHSEDQKPHEDFVKLHNILTEKYPCIRVSVM